MERLKQIRFDDYAEWYLAREVREKGRLPVPNISCLRAAWMKLWHGGKMVPWFETQAEWWICRISDVAELENLLFLPSPWTRAAGLVRDDEPRLLVHAARRSQAAYFNDRSLQEETALRQQAETVGRWRLPARAANAGPLAVPRMLEYYRRHQTGFRLDAQNAVVLRSLEEDERREMERWGCRETNYYLHDGTGRLLSFMALWQRRLIDFYPVTAIVADRIA